MESKKSTNHQSKDSELKINGITEEPKASEPTIISEQHRTANIGPKSAKASQTPYSNKITQNKDQKGGLHK